MKKMKKKLSFSLGFYCLENSRLFLKFLHMKDVIQLI